MVVRSRKEKRERERERDAFVSLLCYARVVRWLSFFFLWSQKTRKKKARRVLAKNTQTQKINDKEN